MKIKRVLDKVDRLERANEKTLDCKCEKPDPDGDFRVGKNEGNYQRCKICFGRIWS